MKRILNALMVVLAIVLTTAATHADEPAPVDAQIAGEATLTVTVGMSGQVRQVVLPGSKLIPKPVDPRTTPIVIRIDDVYPHGDALRYDLTWFGMEPGEYNLSEFLAREDGSDTSGLPAIRATVTSILPADRVLPNEPSDAALPSVGGYRRFLLGAGILWVVGFLAIMFFGRSRRAGANNAAAATPLSRLQMIQRLMEAATSSATFRAADKARLEGLILGFWRDRRQLEDSNPRDALSKLRTDPEAGPLLKQLERWLYERPGTDNTDVTALLEPMYRVIAETADDPAADQAPVAAHPAEGAST